MRDTDTEPHVLASAAEAYRILPGRADGGLLLVCDHASNAFPPGYGTLGLPESELARHIAYDIGVAGVVMGLSQALGAPAILSRFSRLLIDPNRGDDDPTLIMRISDGAVVPGNRHLDDVERTRRIASYYAPYHDAIARTIDACVAAGPPPTLLSIHSFTDNWKGRARPWHVGILWDKDPRLAQPLIAAFEAEGDLVVGDNEPYKGALRGDCMWQHGTCRGLAHAIIEIRQDLIVTTEQQAAWANRIARIMTQLMVRPGLRQILTAIAHHGSLTDPHPSHR